MDKMSCPFCHRPLPNPPYCPACGHDATTANDLSYLKRMAMLGVAMDELTIIRDFSRRYLDQNPQDDLMKYYLFYAQKDPNRYDLKVSVTPEEFSQMIHHMIRTTCPKNEAKLKRFIESNAQDKKQYYLDLIKRYYHTKEYPFEERNKDEEYFKELVVPIVFPEVEKKDNHRRNAFILCGFGDGLYLILLMLTLFLFNDVTKYFSTVLLAVIPSCFLASGVSILLMKKASIPIMIPLTFIFVVIGSYVLLLPESANFFEHCIRVVRSGIEWIRTIQEGFMI